jgi:hypothetical protein
LTPKQTESVVRLLLTLCPAKQPRIDKAFAAAWVEALRPFRYEDVKDAALLYARDKPYFPTVSDILDKMVIKAAPAQRNDLARAQELLRRMRE